ncbi:MAG: COX15/CtaA family protein [Candidatus Acidiferrales bacterium]
MAITRTRTPRGVYRFAVATSIATVLLLMAGALVTNNNAGDSVPDWPLAYGRLIPPLVGGIRFEYSHRVLAGIVSIMTLVLAIWLARVEQRPMARRLGWTALALVIAQGVLGGIRVLVGYPAFSATAHAALAQIFFIVVAGLSLYLSPWWQRDLKQFEDSGSPSLRALAIATTAAIFVQIVLGAAFRHGAIGAMPHFVGAGVVTALVVWTGIAAKRRFGQVRDLRRSVILLHASFGIQILLGIAAWWVMFTPSGLRQPEALYVALTVAHVLGGAFLLGASVILTLVCSRLIRPLAAAADHRATSHSPAERSPESAGV